MQLKPLESLQQASADIGADSLLVQGGGGNSSLKIGNVLYVKASGTWMRDALEKQVFVPLALNSARALAASGTEDFSPARLPGLKGAELKPSIETAMHTALIHACVIHGHPVNVIAATLGPDPAVRLMRALDGLRWAFIPYVMPGAALGAAVRDAVAREAPDVLVLQNHGLVVGAETPAAAAALFRDVERRLSAPRRHLPSALPPTRPAPVGYRWEDNPVGNALACHSDLIALLTAGALVPDQVVYLGGAVATVARLDDLSALEQAWLARTGAPPSLILVAGQGALMATSVSAAGIAMAGLLYEIALRLPVGVTPAVLGADQEAMLRNWDAEKYRRAIDAKRNA